MIYDTLDIIGCYQHNDKKEPQQNHEKPETPIPTLAVGLEGRENGAFHTGRLEQSSAEVPIIDGIHSFSKSLAKKIHKQKGKKSNHGVHEAIVLKYLASWSNGSMRSDHSFYLTLDQIHARCPYFARSTIEDIMGRLEEQQFITVFRKNRNRHKYDRTLWYAVTEDVQQASEEELLYFDAQEAVRLGVPAAVLLRNFQYWSEHSFESGDDGSVEMSPTALANLLPFSVRTIHNALQELTRSDLQKLSCSKPLYGRKMANNAESEEKQIMQDPDLIVQDPDLLMQNPDRIVQNPDNDTSYKTVNKQLETSSKKKPSASVFEISNDAKKLNPDKSLLVNPLPLRDGGPTKGQPVVHILHRSQKQRLPSPIVVDASLWDQITNLATLHAFNHSLDGDFNKLQRESQDVHRTGINNLCWQFLRGIPPSTIYEWYNCEETHLIFTTVLSLYRPFIAKLSERCSVVYEPIVCFGGLECIIGSLIAHRAERPGLYLHGIDGLIRVAHFIKCDISEVCRAQCDIAEENIIQERREEYASPDVDKEDDAWLSPAQKARIFRNGITTRNKAGWYFWNRAHYIDQISMGKKGLARIQELFELNRDLTPATLLEIIDKGMKMVIKRPMPYEDEGEEYWNFRRVKDISHFANALKKVARWTEAEELLIGVTFLGEREEEEVEDGDAGFELWKSEEEFTARGTAHSSPAGMQNELQENCA